MQINSGYYFRFLKMLTIFFGAYWYRRIIQRIIPRLREPSLRHPLSSSSKGQGLRHSMRSLARRSRLLLMEVCMTYLQSKLTTHILFVVCYKTCCRTIKQNYKSKKQKEINGLRSRKKTKWRHWTD